jgi:hypothetical protein
MIRKWGTYFMRMILAAASLLVLAACGGTPATNNDSGNASAPTGNAVANDIAAGASTALNAYRADMVAECTRDAAGRTPPPGITQDDMGRICICAVDRHMGSKTIEELQAAHGNARAEMRQCAADLVPGAPAQ